MGGVGEKVKWKLKKFSPLLVALIVASLAAYFLKLDVVQYILDSPSSFHWFPIGTPGRVWL